MGRTFKKGDEIHSRYTHSFESDQSPITNHHHASLSPIALTSISREERRFLGHRRCRLHRGRTLSHFAGDDALDSPRCDFPRRLEKYFIVYLIISVVTIPSLGHVNDACGVRFNFFVKGQRHFVIVDFLTEKLTANNRSLTERMTQSDGAAVYVCFSRIKSKSLSEEETYNRSVLNG